ncbi:hypothetical protein ARMGADRAFT_1020237, partial [Armillaria gallica]
MKLWSWYEHSNDPWILKSTPMTSLLYTRMSTTEAPTGEYCHPPSGIWTPTHLCTRRSGERV